VPKLLGVRDGALTLGAPNDAHRAKCEQHRADVERIASGVVGAPVRVSVITDTSARHDDHDDHDDRDLPDPRDAGSGPGGGRSPGSSSAPVVQLHPAGPPPADEDIDLDDLVDAPPESVVSPIDRLAQAFPGSELLDERL
jgi:DNA polymerase-3 subunit gamma/tau